MTKYCITCHYYSPAKIPGISEKCVLYAKMTPFCKSYIDKDRIDLDTEIKRRSDLKEIKVELTVSNDYHRQHLRMLSSDGSVVNYYI